MDKTRNGRRQYPNPDYPKINLKRAVELATKLHKQILHYSATKPIVLKYLGYQPKSSDGLAAFAALHRFGLIDEVSDTTGQYVGGGAKLSKLALKIILEKRIDSPERVEAIREAALNPSLHRELLYKYDGELPSNADIKIYLQREKHFKTQDADRFIVQFRATIEYANRSILRDLMIPLPGSRAAILSVPKSMTTTDYRFLVGYIEYRKANLITDTETGRPRGRK